MNDLPYLGREKNSLVLPCSRCHCRRYHHGGHCRASPGHKDGSNVSPPASSEVSRPARRGRRRPLGQRDRRVSGAAGAPGGCSSGRRGGKGLQDGRRDGRPRRDAGPAGRAGGRRRAQDPSGGTGHRGVGTRHPPPSAGRLASRRSRGEGTSTAVLVSSPLKAYDMLQDKTLRLWRLSAGLMTI